jgi:hypothetical protein
MYIYTPLWRKNILENKTLSSGQKLIFVREKLLLYIKLCISH